MESKEHSLALGGGSTVRMWDSLFVLRPTLMFPLWTMTLAGVRLAPGDGTLSGYQWALLGLSLSALFGLVYLLNQFRDRQSDALNGKLFLVATGVLSRAHLIVEAAVLSLMVIVGLSVAGFGHLWLMTAVIFLIAGVIYNYTPLALERSPLGGIVAGAVGGWPLLRLGGQIAGSAGAVWLEMPYVVAFTSSSLLTGLLDREGDIAAGKRTFVVAYGTKAAIFVGVIGFFTAGLWGVLNGDWVILLPALVSFPLLFIAWWNDTIALAVRANKMAIFLLSLTVAVSFPIYLMIIPIYYGFARWYHRQRFGLDYPKF